MTNKTVTFAVVGCGRISGTHIKAIKDAPSAELVAVCDIKPERAKKTADDNVCRYYTNLEEMLSAEKPDVLNICTPSGFHADCAVLAANYGVNVLSEKPLDITKEKLDLMINTCREKGVLLGGIFQRRNTSAVGIAKKAVEEGKIGKMVMADAYLKYYRGQEYYDSDDWRGTWAMDGGGCLMNQCIHGIDLLMHIAGPVKSVLAKCKTLARRIEVEDTAVIIATFENGAVGVIEAATSVNPGQDTIISVHGTEGNIAFGNDGFNIWQTNDNSKKPDICDNMGGLNCGWAGDNLHAVMVEDMAQAVLEGRDPMIPGEEARNAVDLILAVYESSKTGKEVMI